MRSGIVGEKDNLVTMHDILDAQWVFDNTKVGLHSMAKGDAWLDGSQSRPCTVADPVLLHLTHKSLCTHMGCSVPHSLALTHVKANEHARAVVGLLPSMRSAG